jgi:class 3 adenylate cyclase
MRAPGVYPLSVAALLAAWLACFGLSLEDVLGDTAFSPIDVTPAPSDAAYPAVADLREGLGSAVSDLAPGDRLLAVGNTGLRGASSPRWVAALAAFRGRGVEVPVTIERDGAQKTIVLRPPSYARWWPRLVASLVFAGCALFLLVRLRQSEVVRALVVCNLAAAWFMAGWFAGGLLETWASMASLALSLALLLPLTLRAFLLFPHGVAPERGWARWGPWVFAGLALFDASLYWGMPFSHRVGAIGLAAVGVAFAGVFVATLSRGYQISDAIGRRRLRWVVFGAYLASVPSALAQGIYLASPGSAWLVAVSMSGVAVFPLCILIAITRFNFLDIDRVLSSTASLSMLIVLLVACVLFVVPSAAASIGDRLGIHAATAQLLLVAILALPLVPAHRSLRHWIERIFVADRHQLESGIAELTEQLSACQTPEELTRCAGQGLDDLLRPRCCVLYTCGPEVVAPVFSSGAIEVARFPGESPLVAALTEQRGPLALEGVRGGEHSSSLGAFQRAVLETLGVPVVVPVRLEGRLVAFLCLGEKRNGDVYTNSDLVLLALVCDKLASELMRFEQREQLDASEALNERMRPYLGRTLADHLAKGGDLDVGERVVSVLFVDMRGYSSYVQNLEAEQMLSTVNRYADTVSTLIERHGGTVVNFAGDGIMAVFGAPEPLEQMEQAAVAAGRAIIERVPEIAGRLGTLTVGVGIATGTASVNNVHAAGRLHWTALGNTTNLASRLQALTRDFGAAMIIDEATWQRSGDEAQSFRRYEEVPIRGLQRSETLYVMPMPIPADA